MLTTKKRGFTLIELLVVISIIGLLSTLAALSLGTARTKSRDSRRAADMKQLQTAMELYFDKNATYIMTAAVTPPVGCTNTGAATKVSACSGTGTTGINDFLASVATLKDPSNPTTACANPSTVSCEYAFNAATASTYQVNFWLEGATGSLIAGAGKLTQNGISTP